MPDKDRGLLAQGLECAASDTFDILVLLVRELPNTQEEPAVVIIRGVSNLRNITVDDNELVIPTHNLKLKYSAIAGMVGYAWRLQ